MGLRPRTPYEAGHNLEPLEIFLVSATEHGERSHTEMKKIVLEK